MSNPNQPTNDPDISFIIEDDPAGAEGQSPTNLASVIPGMSDSQAKRGPDDTDMAGAAEGLVRRTSVGLMSIHWQSLMENHGRSDQVGGDSFLQSPPPLEHFLECSVSILRALGARHRSGMWGVMIGISGTIADAIKADDPEQVDLGAIQDQFFVRRVRVANISDFVAMCSYYGIGWWSDPAAHGLSSAIPASLFKWATDFAAKLEVVAPGGLGAAMGPEGRTPALIARSQELLDTADPDHPDMWGNSKLAGSLEAISVIAGAEVVNLPMRQKKRPQFDGRRMIELVDKLHEKMASVIGQMAKEKLEEHKLMTQQVKGQIELRCVETQMTLLRKWTAQLKMTA